VLAVGFRWRQIGSFADREKFRVQASRMQPVQALGLQAIQIPLPVKQLLPAVGQRPVNCWSGFLFFL
jgi:hypothetical protein